MTRRSMKHEIPKNKTHIAKLPRNRRDEMIVKYIEDVNDVIGQLVLARVPLFTLHKLMHDGTLDELLSRATNTCVMARANANEHTETKA